MTKAIVLLASATALLLPLTSQAETFTCNFTEPFYSIVYSTASQKAVVTDHVDKITKVYKGVSFKIVSAGEFVLTSKAGKEVARLKLTGEGSDGMSDAVYPYEITTTYLGGPNNGIGGCSSSLLPEKDGQN